jgi:hypothetical protein
MLSGFATSLLALVGGLILLIASYAKGRLAGAKRERDKRAAEELMARDIADAIDKDVAAMPPADAREELGRWTR